MAIENEMILKRYLRDLAGPIPEFWEEVWKNSPTTMEALAAQADARLVRECSRYLPPKARVLEGGCGSGTYLARFAELGHDVTGVDFAQSTVAKLNNTFPDLDVRVGNILQLPFQSETFDAYYSGGVIEHFEDGLTPQIKEAFRVLKPGGVFLVTVPDLNLTRRFSAKLLGNREKIDLDGRKTYIEILNESELSNVCRTTAPADYMFHEFMLPAAYMRRKLSESGFWIEAEMPFSSRWGLLDLETVRSLAGIDCVSRHLGHKIAAAPLRFVDVIEKSSSRPMEWLSTLIGAFAGNLRLYVARKPQKAA